VQAYFDKHFSISENGNKINILWSQTDVFEENPDFLQYWFKSNYVPDSPISIKNTLFLDPEHPNYDRLHRSVLVVEYNKKTGKEFGFENSVLVFSNKRTESDIDLNNPTTILSWKDFLWQGVLHILIGLDHVLFLIVLLLTTVLKVESGKWRGLTSFKPAFINTIKIVTLFTIAHSITLTLAALQLVNINIAFIESVIAFSIIAISINNLFPKYNTHAWIMVFVFGLFHGLGFASVMGDLQFRTVLIERILIMFNVGVELGQLAIVIVVFPILYWLRNSQYYYRFILVPLSLLAIIIASYWVMQRTGLIG